MSANAVALSYLVASVFFILALRGLSSPVSARRGNVFGMVGMGLAVLTTLTQTPNVALIVGGIVVGGVIGSVIARRVQMTAMPELVAFMHSLVGLAAVFIAISAVNNPAAFHQIMTDWFFAINVLASLTAHNGHQSMPVVRCGHHNGIDRLIIQYFAKIQLDFGGWPVGLFQMILGLGKNSGIHVAKDRNFKSFIFGKNTDQISAPASGTNHADADFFVRRCRHSF